MLKKIKNSRFAVNSLILFSGSMVANVFNYIFHLMVGRIVSPAAYGEIESLISLMSIVSVPSMALVMVATRLSASNKAENDLAGSKSVLTNLSQKTLSYGLVAFVLLSAASPAISRYLNINSVWSLVLVWLAMLLSFFSSINTGVLNGWQKFKGSSIAVAWGSGAKLVIGVILIAMGYQVNGAIASFVIAGIIAYFASVYFLKFILKYDGSQAVGERVPTRAPWRGMLFFYLLGNMAINVLGNADMVLAKRNLAEDVAGQYGALNIVGKIIFFATSVIATVAFSMASENNHLKKSSRKLIIRAACLIAGLGLAATAVYFSAPRFVLGMLFGSKYYAVAGYLGFIAIAVSLYSLNNLFLQYYLSVKSYAMICVSLLMSALMIGGILLYGMSISAIIMAVIITQLALFLVQAAYFCFFIEFSHPK